MKANKQFIVIIYLFLTANLFAQYSTLHNFNGDEGRYPEGGLVPSGDTLFGATIQGGEAYCGTLYRLNVDGSGFRNLHTFNSIDGCYPDGSLVLIGTTLYGATRQGGKHYKGNLFSVESNGSGFKSFFDFNDSLGIHPQGPLINVGDTIFGTTGYGGKFNYGVVFRIQKDGTHFEKLLDLKENPVGSLTFFNNYLFGTTHKDASLEGSFYRVRTDGSDFKIIQSYEEGNKNSFLPINSLLLVDSVFYGEAYTDSANMNIYKINPDGSGFKVLQKSIDGYGIGLVNKLTYLNGMLLGATGNDGYIFRVDTSGTNFNYIYNFKQPTGFNPICSLLSIGDTLYGSAMMGGLNSVGTFFRYNTVAVKPQIQASQIKVDLLSCSNLNISWQRGNGTGCAVFMRKGSSEVFNIKDNSIYNVPSYISNSTFGEGDQIENSGWYCVYNGIDTMVSVSGVDPVSVYQVRVCEYNEALMYDEKYNVEKTFNNPLVFETTKCRQWIWFNPLSTQVYGNSNFNLIGVTSSNLPITFHSDNLNIAVIENDSVKLVGAGIVNITASQDGDSIYFPAVQITNKLIVEQALLTIQAIDTVKVIGELNPNFEFKYFGFVGADDSTSLSRLPVATCDATVQSSTGFYNIISSGAESVNYEFHYVNGLLQVRLSNTINTNDFNKLSAFPNPVKDHLNFTTSAYDTLFHIQIINVLGNTIVDKYQNDNKIDLSYLPKGWYVLIVNDLKSDFYKM